MQDKQVIKKSAIRELIRQNNEMRAILQSWPARELMMDFEKTWNEKRLYFLDENPPSELKEEDL